MFQCRTTWLYDPVIYLFTIRLISYKASCIRCLCFFRNLIIWCKYTFKSNDTSFLVIQRTNRCINDIFCSYFCFCFFCFFYNRKDCVFNRCHIHLCFHKTHVTYPLSYMFLLHVHFHIHSAVLSTFSVLFFLLTLHLLPHKSNIPMVYLSLLWIKYFPY